MITYRTLRGRDQREQCTSNVASCQWKLYISITKDWAKSKLHRMGSAKVTPEVFDKH